MVEANQFDVYQSDAGYVAVTNEVRRAILAALLKKERDLNELVKITGKAKPTLSNLHMRELLAQKLIEELPHPTDARRKIYRIRGQRIGSSSVPLEELRGAVKQYVTTSPLAHALRLQQVFDVILAAGPRAQDVVERQGARLGEVSAHLFGAVDVRELLPRLAAYWEREGVTRTIRIDLEVLAVELDLQASYAQTKDAAKLAATLLAGFLRGALAKGQASLATEGVALGGARVRVGIRS